MTINDLRDQMYLEGFIVVKSFNEMGEDEREHYRGLASKLPTDADEANANIEFMFAQITHSDTAGVVGAIIIKIKRV